MMSFNCRLVEWVDAAPATSAGNENRQAAKGAELAKKTFVTLVILRGSSLWQL